MEPSTEADQGRFESRPNCNTQSTIVVNPQIVVHQNSKPMQPCDTKCIVIIVISIVGFLLILAFWVWFVIDPTLGREIAGKPNPS